MIKMRSPGKPYRGMPIRDYFRISSTQDYKVSLAQTSSKIGSKDEYISHLDNYKRFHFEYILDDATHKGQRILCLSIEDGAKEFYLMNKYPDKQIIISDISHFMIKKIQDYTSSKRSKALVTNSQDIPVRNNTFDTVMILGSEYFHDDQNLIRAINEISRVMKPGGSLYMGGWSIDSPPRDGCIKLSTQAPTWHSH